MTTMIKKLEHLTGTSYVLFVKALQEKGFQKVKWIRDRATGNNIVKWAKGHNENRIEYVLTHNWKECYYGTQEPNEIVSAEITGVEFGDDE